jgi:hypothetical protein
MISAGVGDDAVAAVSLRQGSDLVVGAAQFERSDRLKIFRLEIKLTTVVKVGGLVEMRRNQMGANGNTAQARLRVANVVESDDGNIPATSRFPISPA